MDALLFNWIAGLMFTCAIAVNKFNQQPGFTFATIL